MSLATYCALCGDPIDAPLSAYRKITGFIRHRDQGGANAIRLREDTSEFAHVTCVDLAASGIAPSQTRLL